MKSLIAFRPGVIKNGTAFEPMALIYKYLQEHYGYIITVVMSEDDDYYDQAFKIITLPKRVCKADLGTLLFPLGSGRNLNSIFAKADGVLTVDPTVYPQGLLAIQSAHRLEKPVWIDASLTIMSTSQGFRWASKRRLLKEALHKTTGIIVTVPKCIERFRGIGLFDEDIASQFTVMGHPADTTQFTPQTKTSDQDGILRVLVVSRMVPEKGLLYILEAMTTLLQERRNIQLQLLGSGPMQALLKREVEARGLGEKVVFLKPVSHKELPLILGAADVFVNHAVATSQWEEFFGAINIEAMSCGLPCVLSASGGIPYAIREKGVATLVEERNIVQLREAILHLIDSDQERQEIGRKARNYVERHYALPIIAEKYHRMLQHGFAEKK